MEKEKQAAERLTELEIRFEYQEQTIRELSDVVYRQQQQLDVLQSEIAGLEGKVGDLGDSLPPRAPEDEVPPHY